LSSQNINCFEGTHKMYQVLTFLISEKIVRLCVWKHSALDYWCL